MPAPKTHEVEFFEDSGGSLMGYVEMPDATVATSTKISGVTYSVINEISGTTLVTASTLTVSSVIFDTLQTDARWDLDSVGYNFRYDVQSTEIPDGGKKYVFEFRFVPVTGQPVIGRYRVRTVNLYRS